MIGVYMVFIYSPINNYKIDGGGAFTDFLKEEAETNRRNNLLKWGVYAVLLGSAVQLISNFIPSGDVMQA